jgi:hypothetical protein
MGVLPDLVGAYTASIEFRHAAADVAGTAVWNLRGPATVGSAAYIKSIRGVLCFDGTPAPATTLHYGFFRGTGAASPTGGVAIVPTKKVSTYPASTLADLQQGVLDTTGITYATSPLAVVALQVATNGQVEFDLEFKYDVNDTNSEYVFGPDEHLGILVETTNAVVGFGIYGLVEFDERI